MTNKMTIPESSTDIKKVAINYYRGCLVVTIQIELVPDVLTQLKHDLSQAVADYDVMGVILDFSNLKLLDAFEFKEICSLLSVLSLMGARPVIAGLRAGIVASLIDMDINLNNLETVLGLEEAFALFEAKNEKSRTNTG